MKRQGRTGFTLIELLVSMGLALLGTAMLIALFVPSMSLFRRQSGKSDSYRGCLMMMEKFRLGLMNSQMETVTIAPNGQAISWQLIVDDTPFSGATGDALMSPKFALVSYHPEEKRVYYKEFDYPDYPGPQSPSILSIEELEQACYDETPKGLVMARDIIDFQITDKDGDVFILEPPLRLTITSEVDTKGTETNDTESYSLEATVTPRSMRW